MAESLLATVALAALALAAAGFLAQRLRLPPVMGYLGVGLLLSPHVVGRQFFPSGVLMGIADVGVLFLLFFIGLELDLGKLRRALQETRWTIPFHTFVPLVAIAAVGRLMGWSFNQSLVLGAAVAVSSTILGERLATGPRFSSRGRQRVLGMLVVEDLLSGALLAVVAILASSAALGVTGSTTGIGWLITWDVGRLLFLLILLAAGALLLVPRILDEVARTHIHELVVLWGIGLVALFGYVGYLAGTAELGAFIAGMAAADAGSRYVTRNALQGIRDASIALFFFASGVATDILPTLANPLPAIAVAVVFLVTKYLINAPAAAAAGLSLPESLRSAFALGTVGEYALIMVAVATREGLAHPLLLGTVVGAMLLTLPISALMLRAADPLARGFWRLPRPIRDPPVWLATSLRRMGGSGEGKRSRLRTSTRSLAANGVLLAALLAATPWLAGQALRRLPDANPLITQAAVWGIALAVSAPLLRGAFRGYRDTVWALVGLRPGERVGAGRVRTRFVDAWVAVSAVLILAFAALFVPATLPVLAAAAVVAAVVAVVAWRSLARFHNALEETVARVLGGEEEEKGQMLDKVLQRYPWGVRSSAVSIPPDSPIARHTLQGSRIADLTGAMVAVLHRRGKETVNPSPDTVLLPGDTLVMMGDPNQLARAEALIVAHGDALRMTIQSKQAVVAEVRLDPASPWVGSSLEQIDLRGNTGTLIAGVWPRGATRPIEYDGQRILQPGDRLLIVGTPLQVDRATASAAAPATAPDSDSREL